MIPDQMWDMLRMLLQWLIIPLFLYVWKEHKKEMSAMKEQIHELRVKNATMENQMINITERLGEIKGLINALLNRRRDND